MRATAPLFILALGLGTALGFASNPDPVVIEGDAHGPGFAVVELFTSEGCSSCPPADANLDAIAGLARTRKQPVFALAYHVEYWDRLGWADPYASIANTRRQKAYAQLLNHGQLYTPQLIINGREQFSGNHRAKARDTIRDALQQPASVMLSAQAVLEADWTVKWHVQGAPVGAKLNIALVEDQLISKVTRGENQGRTLTHNHVVRALYTVPLTPGDSRGHKIVKANGQNTRVILFVQDPSSMAILGAVAAAQ